MELYCVTLDDYANPSFVSFSKDYYGTLNQVAEFVDNLKSECPDTMSQIINAFEEYKNGNEKVQIFVAQHYVKFLEKVDFIGEKILENGKYEWEHLNIYRFPYEMRCDKVIVTLYWIKTKKKYLRIYKAQFTNLQYKSIATGKWNDCDWAIGFPCIYMDGTNSLMISEKAFDTLDEVQADMASLSSVEDVDFTEFCNDIFADG